MIGGTAAMTELPFICFSGCRPFTLSLNSKSEKRLSLDLQGSFATTITGWFTCLQAASLKNRRHSGCRNPACAATLSWRYLLCLLLPWRPRPPVNCCLEAIKDYSEGKRAPLAASQCDPRDHWKTTEQRESKRESKGEHRNAKAVLSDTDCLIQ